MTANSAQFAVSKVASDDLDLVHASKRGDLAAFEQLVKRYDRRLFRISQTVTHNREDSEDAVQEAFLKAFQNLAEFREDSQFSTWLIRITVNQSLMKLRKQRAQKEFPLDEDPQADGDVPPVNVPDRAPNPEQLCWASELRDILVRTLKESRPILRTVFVLRDVEGLSISTLAPDELAQAGRVTKRLSVFVPTAFVTHSLGHIRQVSLGNVILSPHKHPVNLVTRRPKTYHAARRQHIAGHEP
jgi:RNA polymerase sigma-70 factor (ECF subfamily)